MMLTQSEFNLIYKNHCKGILNKGDTKVAPMVKNTNFGRCAFGGTKWRLLGFINCKFNGPVSQCDFERCNFEFCSFSGSEIRNVDFFRSTFVDCKFVTSKIYYSSFRNANFENCSFKETVFRGTSLSGVKGLINPTTWLKENFEETDSGFIVYKAFGSTYYKPPVYWDITPGKYIEEVCNPNRVEDCGCGVNFATLKWIKKTYGEQLARESCHLWRCLLEWRDLAGVVVPYHTDGKARCAKLKLLGQVTLNKLGEWVQ